MTTENEQQRSREYYQRNRDRVLARVKEYAKQNPHKVAATKALWYQRNKKLCADRAKLSKQRRKSNKEYVSKQAAYARDYRSRHPDRVLDQNLKTRFGISLDLYKQLLEAQGGVCAICGLPPTTRRLSVDHCHSTGRVRGLLHGTCNTALGHLKDRADLLRRAADYLDSFATIEQV